MSNNTAVAENTAVTETTNAETTNVETVETAETETKVISKRRYTRGRSSLDESEFYLNGIYTTADTRNLSALLKAMERKSETPREICQILRHMLVPRNHDNYLPFNKAVESVMGEVDPKTLPNIRAQVMQATFNFLRDFAFGHDHEMYRIERQDAGLPVGGRYRSRRSEDYRNWETAQAEARRAIRDQIGAAPKGRLTEDLQAQFDTAMNAWLEDNPAPDEED